MCVHVHVCTRACRDQCLHLVFCSLPYFFFFFETVCHWSWSSPIWLNPLASKPSAPPHPTPSSAFPAPRLQAHDYRFMWMLEIQTQVLIHASTLSNQSSSQSSCVGFFSFFWNGVLCSPGWPLTAYKAQDWPWNHVYAPPPQLCWDLNSADSCRLGKHSTLAPALLQLLTLPKMLILFPVNYRLRHISKSRSLTKEGPD